MTRTEDLSSLALKLSRNQRRWRWFNYPFWLLCEIVALILRRPVLSPRENTRRCYEDFFDPLCADTDVWPDYTEGYYPTGKETYEEAKTLQFQYILEHTRTEADSRVLDLGCGNGKLSRMAQEKGARVTGVTVSREQARACRALGLDVKVSSFENIDRMFPEHSFDTVILNGPTEHFVTEEQALHGEEEAVRRRLFEICHRLLKPGGRIFITCIHFRWPTEINECVKFPLRHPSGSYYFQCSVLIRLYSGWYPDPGTYERIATRSGFELTHQRDATHDYYLTSMNWSRRLRGYLKRNPDFKWKFLKELFFKDPRYFFITYLYWIYDSWTWQFAGRDRSPLMHKWLMFEKSA